VAHDDTGPESGRGFPGSGGNEPANLPVALLAGALADIVDKRRLLIVVESFITVSSTALAALVWLEPRHARQVAVLDVPRRDGRSADRPAWQSIVPQLVPRQDLPEAVAANSVGVNVSRAVGPALGGVITVAWGIAAPFWANAGSNLGSIGGCCGGAHRRRASVACQPSV